MRHLANSGHSPESIAAAVPWRSVMLHSANGELSEEQFASELSREVESGGKPFDSRRSFCSEGELIIHEGKTYAFSNKWGPRTQKAMDQMIAAFPDSAISYRKYE